MQTKKYKYLLLTLLLFIGVGIYFINHNRVHNNHKNNITKATLLNYNGSTILKEFNQTDTDKYQTAAGTYDISTMASNVTSTLVSSFSNASTKPLPLVANWNTGIPEYQNGLDPMYMINKLASGEHVLPSWKLDPYYNDNIGQSYYEASIKKAAELGLALVFILPSPESALTNDDVYFTMNEANNPNVITTDGTILPKLSPFGPNSLWYEVGGQWSTTSLMAQIQEWYPNPPLILFVDEDASNKLSWNELSSSSRYTSEYPIDKSDEFKKTLVNAKWIEKYRQLHKGFKDGFIKTAWKNNVKFVSRNQLAANMGQTADWANNATTTNLHANIWPYTTDALTVDFDLDGNKTDSSQNAPHITANNLPFMLEEAKTINPNFNYQLSINANGKIDNPQRYRGYTQFALWFLRPSIIRQKTAATSQEDISSLFQEVIDSVELVNYNPILADFWENGKLVETGTSPFNKNIPTQYNTIPRWFLLNTDSTQTVWAFALVKGEAPNREWLVYVQSPEENLTDISVTIPEYANVELNSTQEGSFYSLHENNITISPLNSLNTVKNNSENNTSRIKLGNGTTYYFDATNGNDNNDGLSEETAWKTLSKINSLKLSPGDNLLFKRGEEWHGERLIDFYYPSGDENNPITISSYGNENDPKPVISTIDIQKMVWTKVGNNIWVSQTIAGNPYRVFKNDTEILKARYLNELSERQPWFYSSENKKLYVYSLENPNNDTFKFSKQFVGLYLDKQNYIVVNNLNIQGGTSISLNNSTHIHIKNSIIGVNSSYGIHVINSSDTIIENNIFDTNFTLDYSWVTPGGSGSDFIASQDGVLFSQGTHDSIIRNNYFKNWNHASISMSNRVDEKGIYNNEIYNNTLTAPDIAYGGRIAYSGNVFNNNINYNLIKDISVRNQLGGFSNHFHHNIIDTVHSSPLKDANLGQGIELEAYNGSVYNNVYEYNTIINCDGAGISLIANTNDSVKIENNIFNNNYIKNCGLNKKYGDRTDIFIQNYPQIENQTFKYNFVGSTKIYYKKYVLVENLKDSNQFFNTVPNDILVGAGDPSKIGATFQY